MSIKHEANNPEVYQYVILALYQSDWFSRNVHTLYTDSYIMYMASIPKCQMIEVGTKVFTRSHGT